MEKDGPDGLQGSKEQQVGCVENSTGDINEEEKAGKGGEAVLHHRSESKSGGSINNTLARVQRTSTRVRHSQAHGTYSCCVVYVLHLLEYMTSPLQLVQYHPPVFHHPHERSPERHDRLARFDSSG